MRIARSVLLIVGILCLGVYSYVLFERMGSQAYANWSFEHSSKRPDPVQVTSTEPLRREALIGRISISRLQLTAMVREGDDAKTLRLAVGHIPATPLPGQPGNVGIAGHRDTFFRRLGELKAGDRIGFATVDGDFAYEVESSKVVEPADVAVLADSREKILTMVTCYPFHYIGNAPQRFIVRARQVLATAAH